VLCRGSSTLVVRHRRMRRVDLKRLLTDASRRRLDALRAQNYAALLALPNQRSEAIHGTKAVVSTYRDALGKGRLRIVVRGVLPGWLGFAYVRVQGFTVDPEGNVVPLPKDALRDFR